MIQRLFAIQRSLHIDAKVLLHLPLADIVRKFGRANSQFKLLFVGAKGCVACWSFSRHNIQGVQSSSFSLCLCNSSLKAELLTLCVLRTSNLCKLPQAAPQKRLHRDVATFIHRGCNSFL